MVRVRSQFLLEVAGLILRTQVVVHLGCLCGDQLRCLQTTLVLLFKHVDLDVVVAFQEAELILKSTHGLLGVHTFFLCLYAQLCLKIAVLFLENFEDSLLVLEFSLQALSYVL